MALLLMTVGSCNKINSAMKDVKAKVAGQAIDANGHGVGYLSVKLIPDEGGDPYITVAEDSGNFMFEEVTPGKYTMQVLDVAKNELPSDNPHFYVGPGKTVTQNINVDRSNMKN
jgi:hypothetical protein